MKRLLRVFILVVLAAAAYLIIGIVLSSFIFPQPAVDHANYFRPGDKLISRFEGFDQTVIAVEGEWMHTRLEVLPNAPGPPEHFHERFAENFTVKSGTLSILVNGEKRTLRAGESISIPPMTRHKPFNETNETVVVESPDPKTLPVKFGYFLSQMYGLMDTYENGPSTPAILMQLSVYGNDADSWIADGPPLVVQKAMRVALAPTARLLGYSNYYPEYAPRR
jgi:quercetin dioxygenase-like cupin family protein